MSAANDPSEQFSISLDFIGEQCVLAARGQLDAGAVTELSTLLEVVIANGYPSIVMDLADLDFMSSAALAVIAAAAHHLDELDRQLTIVSPSAAVWRLLDVAGMTHLTRPRPTEPTVDHLGPASARSGHHHDGNGGRDREAVTGLASDSGVVDGALRLVVSLARATVGGADGVSVSLRRHGHLTTVAASDRTIEEMDASQYATGQGPCVDASIEGRRFYAEALDVEQRWPSFTPRARALGINAILSSPLLASERPVGALNIYSRSPSAFGPDDQRLASVFASEASVIVADAGVDVSDDQQALRIRGALRTRQIIAQAQGVLMEREGIGEDMAYRRLRLFSQATGRPLRDRAVEVVASTAPSAIPAAGDDRWRE